nr:MAG TPA: hypothetical protein [Caudoviricetes sp.]
MPKFPQSPHCGFQSFNYFLFPSFLSTFIPYSRQWIDCREWEA